MAGEFTTWCEFLTVLQDAFVSGSTTETTVSQGDKSITYNSFDEFMKKMEWVEKRCEGERGTYTRRTYAGQR